MRSVCCARALVYVLAAVAQQVLLVPRIAVEQGLRPDGSIKVRPVDHFSWSFNQSGKRRTRTETKAGSVNGHYTMPGAVRHDHLDDLLSAMRMFWTILGQVVVFTFGVVVAWALIC